MTLQPGSNLICVPYTPTFSGHTCVQVIIRCPGFPDQISQRNLDNNEIIPPGGSDSLQFTVCNPDPKNLRIASSPPIAQSRGLIRDWLATWRLANFERLHLHAQKDAVPFYRKAGFLPEGGEFMEAGIPHQAMSLALPIPFEAPENVPRAAVREEPAPPEAAEAELRQHVGEGDCVQGLLDSLTWPLRTVRLYSQLTEGQTYTASGDVLSGL